MAKKEKPKQDKYIKLEEIGCCYECIKIPNDATHVETELDYSNCYYEGDMPSIKLIFSRLEKA